MQTQHLEQHGLVWQHAKITPRNAIMKERIANMKHTPAAAFPAS